MKKIIPIVLCLISFYVSAQAQSIDSTIERMEGLWIQEDFFKSFDSTRSITLSRNAFPPELPVGLRINRKEIKDSILTIGYSFLHDHMIHPEVSGFSVQNNDTVYEQGSFLVDLRINKGQMPLNVGYVLYFNEGNTNSFLSIQNTGSKTMLCLVNDRSDTIKFVRFEKEITEQNPFPNPLYNYTLNRTLTGNYKLFSANKKLLSKDFVIKDNGDVTGYKDFERKKIHYSTDIYCGVPIGDQIDLISEHPLTGNMDNVLVWQSYIIEKSATGDVLLYDYKWEDYIEVKKRIKYILRMK